MDFPPAKVRISLDQDQFENSPRWEAHLNNGITVYSDGEYIDGASDWERLQNYCKDNNVKIDTFLIAFRDHKVFVDKSDGYYFRRMFLGSFGGTNKEYFIVGGGVAPLITIYKYALPELMLYESEEREVTNEDLI